MNNVILKKLTPALVAILYVVIVLIRIPPFYIFFYPSSLFTSHNLARVLIFSVFSVLFFSKNTINKDANNYMKISYSLILVFLLSQSLSIVKTIDVISFLKDYKDLISSLVLFYISSVLITKNNIFTVLRLLIFTGIVLFLYQLFLYFFPDLIFTFLKPFFYGSYWDFIEYQFNRQRFFSDIFNEFLIPVFVYYLICERALIIKFFSLLSIWLIVFFSIISNWRTKLATTFFALGSSILYMLLWKKVRFKIVVFIICTFVGIVILSDSISLITIGFNSLDRLMLPTKNDTQNIFSRIDYWREAFSFISYSPLTGVGLGNYYDVSSDVKTPTSSVGSNITPVQNPHNIFASIISTSGLLGFSSFIILMLWFLKNDIKRIKKDTSVYSFLIIGFWTLFLHSLANPNEFFVYMSIFWLLRGALAHTYTDYL